MTLEEEEKWIRRMTWIKVGAFVLMCVILFIAASRAEAATFGNATSPAGSNTTYSLSNVATQNSEKGLLQTWSTSVGFVPATLDLWLSKTGTPTDDITVRLCAYADLTAADPCEAPASVIYTWTLDAANLDTYNASLPLQDPETLPFITASGSEDVYLYSSIPYSIVIERSGADSSNFPRWTFNASQYADGAGAHAIYGSCTGWVGLNATSPSNCSDTSGSKDFLFRFTELDSGALTISPTVVGGTAYISGACVEPADLPDGWSLDTNYVAVKYLDTTGTFVLDTPDCSSGGYTASRNLWNGDFIVSAAQSGSPHTFTASATFTIDIDDNPVTDPMTLAFFDCTDLGFEEESFQCRMFNAVQPFTNLWPYSWIVDIKLAMDNATSTSLSAVITVPADMGAGEERTLNLFSSSSSTGLVGEINGLPEIGGKTLREWIEMVLRIGILGAYAALRFYTLYKSDV